MDLDLTNRWLNLVANVGVIIGIIFLAIEVQQSNKIAIVGTEIDVRNGFSEINQAVYSDPELSVLLARMINADVEFSIDEDLRVYSFVQQWLNTYLAVETAYRNDLIPGDSFVAIEDDLRALMITLPKIREYFRRAYDGYPTASDTQVLQTVGR